MELGTSEDIEAAKERQTNSFQKEKTKRRAENLGSVWNGVEHGGKMSSLRNQEESLALVFRRYSKAGC